MKRNNLFWPCLVALTIFVVAVIGAWGIQQAVVADIVVISRKP